MTQPQFSPGDLVHHKKFDYRGVVVDLDPEFAGSEEWYEYMARSRPPKDRPWYHVLVDGAEHSTYVAERHLEPDETGPGPSNRVLNGVCHCPFSPGSRHADAGVLAVRQGGVTPSQGKMGMALRV